MIENMDDDTLNDVLDRQLYNFLEVVRQDYDQWAPNLLILILNQSYASDLFKRNHIEINKDLLYEKEANARLLEEDEDLSTLLRTCYEKRQFAAIRTYKGFHQPVFKPSLLTEYRDDLKNALNVAYTREFIGDAHEVFLSYLEAQKASPQNLYARTVSVIQSSGTGKSRMLTEAGKLTFTFPMCIRPDMSGFPMGDKSIYDYFNDPEHRISKWDDMSTSAHVYTACFLEALYLKALQRLQELYASFESLEAVLEKWHHEMELEHPRATRAKFYRDVCKKAKSLKRARYPNVLPDSPYHQTATADLLESTAKEYYSHAMVAVIALLDFIKKLGHEAVCITYIDEAPELGSVIWVLTRLVSQSKDLDMWYVFMGTKSAIDYFSPEHGERHSLREGEILLPPYYVLGYDQNISAHHDQVRKSVTMKELSSVSHLAKYGRPLWGSYTELTDDDLIEIAAYKLIYASPSLRTATLDTRDRYSVLAVLSQRLCIDTAVGPGEPSRLADRSISKHLRLLSGFSAGDSNIYYTQSPSEPMLTLAAFDLLYNDVDSPASLANVLHTFNSYLCSAGLVERSLMGELPARLLILTARDYAAPVEETTGKRNIRVPVTLLSVLERLFGRKCWDDKFEEGLQDVYVNLTHWGRMTYPLPEVLDQNFLANFWFRGSGLQCAFNQESLDLFIVTYSGSVDDNAVFDCEKLSAWVVQVNFKQQGDSDASATRSLRPIGIPRGINPLPYLAMVMELGCESAYQTPSNPEEPYIHCSSPSVDDSADFMTLRAKRISAKEKLDRVENIKSTEYKTRKQEFKDARWEEDRANRYEIQVRGSKGSTYGVLVQAGIEEEFEAILKMREKTTRAPVFELAEALARTMDPLSSLSDPKGWVSSCYDDDAMNTGD